MTLREYLGGRFMNSEMISLIDIGSNTIRLVIFEIGEDYRLYELQNIKTPARLSQYLNEDKVMSQDGIDVLVNVLDNFYDVSKRYKVSKLMPMATAAIRQAANQADILKQVKKKVGIQIQIIPEEKEAFYGSYAVARTTQTKNSVTVDIGGGSTEITLFENKKIINYHSFPFGVVTLKQLFFTDKDHNNDKAIEKMTQFVKEQFKSLKWLKKCQLPITAIGGSARSIANVHQRTVDYPLGGVHGYQMSANDLNDTLELFKSLTIPELQNLDGLSQDRADIIIPANVVFKSLFEEVKAPVFIFSNKGLREGIIMDYINEKTDQTAFSTQNVANQSIYRLGLAYHTQDHVADYRGFLVSALYEELCKQNIFEKDGQIARLLQYGSYLYYMGEYIENSAGSQHTFYIISNSELDGVSHQDRVVISLLASYKNKSLFNQYIKPFHHWFNVSYIDHIRHLGGVIKFANALNDSHMSVIKKMSLVKTKDGYDLQLFHNGPVIAERYRASRQKKHLDRLLRNDLNLSFIELP